MMALILALGRGFRQLELADEFTMESLWPAWISMFTAIGLLIVRWMEPSQYYWDDWMASHLVFSVHFVAMGWMAILRGTEFVTCAWWKAIGVPWLLAFVYVVYYMSKSPANTTTRTNTIASPNLGFAGIVLSTSAVLVLRADGFIPRCPNVCVAAILVLHQCTDFLLKRVLGVGGGF